MIRWLKALWYRIRRLVSPSGKSVDSEWDRVNARFDQLRRDSERLVQDAINRARESRAGL